MLWVGNIADRLEGYLLKFSSGPVQISLFLITARSPYSLATISRVTFTFLLPRIVSDTILKKIQTGDPVPCTRFFFQEVGSGTSHKKFGKKKAFEIEPRISFFLQKTGSTSLQIGKQLNRQTDHQQPNKQTII